MGKILWVNKNRSRSSIETVNKSARVRGPEPPDGPRGPAVESLPTNQPSTSSGDISGPRGRDSNRSKPIRDDFGDHSHGRPWAARPSTAFPRRSFRTNQRRSSSSDGNARPRTDESTRPVLGMRLDTKSSSATSSTPTGWERPFKDGYSFTNRERKDSN